MHVAKNGIFSYDASQSKTLTRVLRLVAAIVCDFINSRTKENLSNKQRFFAEEHHTRVLPQQQSWSKGKVIDTSTIGT
uniref:hypothetical protein n=1 Tax=Limnohabitans sp. TaxID=1907725 RepID=UPI004047BA29